MEFYENMGFVKVDECHIPLLRTWGDEGVYTHVAMVREPKVAGDKSAHAEASNEES